MSRSVKGVEIAADAYPDARWIGTVASISPATGAEFALIPPQNATGNWVKVVQRLPVQIAVEPRDGQPALRAGMTVTVFDRHRARAGTRQVLQPRGRGGRGEDSRAAATPHTGLGRALVLLSVILATTLYATTLTIANVALPQIQGDLSASIDQIAWVLTFNIVATAIATPPTGWLAARLGRKRLLGAVLGFTISTLLCGLASSLPELILWRSLPGLFGRRWCRCRRRSRSTPSRGHSPALGAVGHRRDARADSRADGRRLHDRAV